MGAKSVGTGSAVFRERLVPGVTWWVVVGALVAMLAIAYGAALGTAAGLWVGAVAAPIAVIALWRASPVIEVGHESIHADSASLPRDAAGAARILHGDALAAARRGLDPEVSLAAYAVLPPWASATAVVLEVTDPDDPHRSWLIATRHPDRLVSCLTERGDLGAPSEPDSPPPG